MQLTLSRLTVRECRHGVHLVKRNRNVLISACHIYNNRGVGVYYDNVNLHQSNIVGCHISYCDGGGVVFRGGEVRNVHIGTCDIEGNQSKDGPPTANILIDCTGGSTAEVVITGWPNVCPQTRRKRRVSLTSSVRSPIQFTRFVSRQ